MKTIRKPVPQTSTCKQYGHDFKSICEQWERDVIVRVAASLETQRE